MNCRQARWSMSLSYFDFVITYCSENFQEKLDAFSLRSYLAPRIRDIILDKKKSIILKPSNLQLKALTISTYADTSLMTKIQRAMKTDPFVDSIQRRLKNTLVEENNNFKLKDGLLYFKDLLYIPPDLARLQIL